MKKGKMCLFFQRFFVRFLPWGAGAGAAADLPQYERQAVICGTEMKKAANS
ncbi:MULTISPECIES: hypothetical protein [unclassified Janthinobacterium]|uniref:hypothetical protein n=1 Tax=unclassified Janthinobacterium TaxID=2610881 RepID=UPI0018CB3377|nr:hypothetical protein [Janthinobacterium sp. CG_23.4]MDH6157382.1 hypothetical protein [Janthinobacterium sp. CG_23.4]